MSYDIDFKRLALVKLAGNNNNITKTATDLGVPRTTLSDWASDPELINDPVKVDMEREAFIEAEQFIKEKLKELQPAIDKKLENENTSAKELIDIYEKMFKMQNTIHASKPKEKVKKEKPSREVVAEAIQELVEAASIPIEQEQKKEETKP